MCLNLYFFIVVYSDSSTLRFLDLWLGGLFLFVHFCFYCCLLFFWSNVQIFCDSFSFLLFFFLSNIFIWDFCSIVLILFDVFQQVSKSRGFFSVFISLYCLHLKQFFFKIHLQVHLSLLLFCQILSLSYFNFKSLIFCLRISIRFFLNFCIS